MRRWIVFAGLGVCAIALYLGRDQWVAPLQAHSPWQSAAASQPADGAPVRRLAPAGTFFVLQYVSIRTAHGIAGFEPGTKVQLVSIDKDNGNLLVTDGHYQMSLEPKQVTDDIDVAAAVRTQDQVGQEQLELTQQEAEKKAAAAQHVLDVEHAKQVASIHDGAIIGGPDSPLNQPSATPANRPPQVHSYPAGGPR